MRCLFQSGIHKFHAIGLDLDGKQPIFQEVIMPLTLLLFFLFFQSPEVPYRNKDDFQIELKYDLRTRPAVELNKVQLDPNPTGVKRQKTGMLPYLLVTVKIFNVKPEEVRFRCEDNTRTVFNRKLSKSSSFVIDMGYIDDIKDGLASNDFTVIAVSRNKEPLNRIHMKIEKDGTFLVNGEKRGKF